MYLTLNFLQFPCRKHLWGLVVVNTLWFRSFLSLKALPPPQSLRLKGILFPSLDFFSTHCHSLLMGCLSCVMTRWGHLVSQVHTSSLKASILPHPTSPAFLHVERSAWLFQPALRTRGQSTCSDAHWWDPWSDRSRVKCGPFQTLKIKTIKMLSMLKAKMTSITHLDPLCGSLKGNGHKRAHLLQASILIDSLHILHPPQCHLVIESATCFSGLSLFSWLASAGNVDEPQFQSLQWAEAKYSTQSNSNWSFVA